jgi:hypothetical protein
MEMHSCPTTLACPGCRCRPGRTRTTSAGLSAAEAAQRLASHGLNCLTPPQKRGPLLRFLLQFHNVLIGVLLGAAVAPGPRPSGRYRRHPRRGGHQCPDRLHSGRQGGKIARRHPQHAGCVPS